MYGINNKNYYNNTLFKTVNVVEIGKMWERMEEEHGPWTEKDGEKVPPQSRTMGVPLLSNRGRPKSEHNQDWTITGSYLMVWRR